MRSNVILFCKPKQMLSLSIAALTIICNATPAYASDLSEPLSTSLNENVSSDSMNEYVNLAMSNYIIAAGLDISSNFSITSGIPIFNEGELTPLGYAVYLVSDDGTVGEMNVFCCGNSFSSDFSLIPNLTTTSFTQNDLCVILNNGGKWLCFENNDVVPLIENCSYELAPTDCSQYASVTLNDFDINSECLIAPLDDIGATIGSVSLNVSHVSNNYAVNGGNGICWAATIAMKVNFLKGTNYSALDIYNYAKNNLNSTVGSMTTVQNLYSAFGISVTATNNQTNFLTNQEAWNILKNSGSPIDLAIYGYENSSGTGTERYHQVLLTGMTIGSTGLSYQFFCPNNSAKKYVYISGNPSVTTSKKMSDFVYTDTWSYRDSNPTLYWKKIYRMYY